MLQLQGFADNIDWIPMLLPRNIKFIVSMTETASIEKLRDTAVFVEVSVCIRSTYTISVIIF